MYGSRITHNPWKSLYLKGIILGMHPANERRRYTVTSPLIGWAHTQNDPCFSSIFTEVCSLGFSWQYIIIGLGIGEKPLHRREAITWTKFQPMMPQFTDTYMRHRASMWYVVQYLCYAANNYYCYWQNRYRSLISLQDFSHGYISMNIMIFKFCRKYL